MRDIIIDLQKSDTWKIQLTIAINFISSKDAEEDRVMHSRSDNIKLTSDNDANKVVDVVVVEVVKPFINKYNWKGIYYPSKIDDWKTLRLIRIMKNM